MHCYFSLVLLLYTASALATPALHKRVDLEGNGIPDWCLWNADGSANCLAGNGQWTSVPSSIASPQTSTSATSATSQIATSKPASTSVSASGSGLARRSTKARRPSALSSAALSSSALSSSSTSSSIATSAAPSSAKITTSATPSVAAGQATGTLPSPSQFKTDNGTKWTIQYVGDIKYTGTLASKNLTGDKCRSSQIGSQTIWNCGDMMCSPDYTVCGFSMGPAFFGTSDVMTINTNGVQYVNNNNFIKPWSGDPTPVAPQTAWGMDTSNVAAINDTHGVAFAWEAWRGASDGSMVSRGNAVASITIGQTMPIATRMGPLLTDASHISLGLVAILRDGAYIYIYSAAGPSKLIVTRVLADDSVFDATKYESLVYGTTNWAPGIPLTTDTQYGMSTANSGGQFGCAVYGSAFYSAYLKKYVIICNIYMSFTNMYTSDTPYGPWSAEYGLLNGWTGYGSMAHPEYSTDGGKTIYFSQGPDGKFNMFKVSFGY